MRLCVLSVRWVRLLHRLRWLLMVGEMSGITVLLGLQLVTRRLNTAPPCLVGASLMEMQSLALLEVPGPAHLVPHVQLDGAR